MSTDSPRIGIVDYGMGNRRSVEKALSKVGARAFISADHAALAAADGLVLPGVGAFPAAIAVMEDLGLDALLVELAAQGMPLFGSCMGMQLLFESSEEHQGASGLGLLKGEVRLLRSGGLKLPHIGWSAVCRVKDSPLWGSLPQRIHLYHVHSYVAEADPDQIVAEAEYGQSFPAVVGSGNIFGAQSHPEKSSTDGLALLANFLAICAAAPARQAPSAPGGAQEGGSGSTPARGATDAHDAGRRAAGAPGARQEPHAGALANPGLRVPS